MTERDTAGPVLVVDDHPLISRSLVIALGGQDIEAAAVPIGRMDDIVAAIRRHPPGLVVLDLNLGDPRSGAGSGLQLVEPLRELGWSVLILTGARDTAMIADAIARGAVGWVSKTEPFEKLLDTVVDAANGREVLSAEDRDDLVRLHDTVRNRRHDLGLRLNQLTKRERQVLDRLAEGHSAADIAWEFTVSIATVRAQIRSILAKLDVQSQLAAVAMLHAAQKAGLV